MKNYALNKKDSEHFITEFEVLDDRIIVFFADGHNEIRQKSKEEVTRILKVLENQIKHSSKKKNQLYNHITSTIKAAFYLIVLSVLSTCCLNYYGYSASALFLIPASTLIISSIMVYKDTTILRDIDKHKTFLENKQKILDNIKSNPTVLMNTTALTQGVVERQMNNPTEYLEDEPINLQNIEQIPKTDIDLILENAECLEQLGYVSPEGEDKIQRFRPKK